MDNQPNLDWTAVVSERRIQEAIDAGEFENLPGKGQPLDLEVDASIPLSQRIANRILKNARALPDWLQLEKDIERETREAQANRESHLRAIRHARNDAARTRIIARLRDRHREKLDLINLMILKYNYIAPAAAQRSFVNRNIAREMAALESEIEAAAQGMEPAASRQ